MTDDVHKPPMQLSHCAVFSIRLTGRTSNLDVQFLHDSVCEVVLLTFYSADLVKLS